MRMKRQGIQSGVLVGFIFLVMLVPFSSASITLHNESIVRTYVGGATIRGIINISFSGEGADTLLQSTIPGGKNLLDFLKAANARAGIDYNCSIQSCMSAYAATGEGINSLTLDGISSPSIGFILEGKDVMIKTLDFIIASEIPTSCTPPLLVFALDENVSAIRTTEYVADSSFCQKSTSGCFASDLSESDYKFVTLSTTKYCNRMALEPAPAHVVSAALRATSNSSPIVFTLFGAEGEQRGSCTTGANGIGNQEARCTINYSISAGGEYSVCVHAKESKNEYELRFESKGAVCGGAGVDKITSGDYEVRATALPYAPFTNMSIAGAYRASTGRALLDEADRYLERVYGRDCSKGCTIPFTLQGISQSVQLRNASIVYVAEDNRVSDRSIRTLQKQVPLLTTNHQLLLDIAAAAFVLPTTANNPRFTLRAGETNLLGSGIPLNVTPGFDFEIVPRIALPGVETTFSAITSENISESLWDFGDGVNVSVNGASASHRYSAGLNYTLRVTLKNSLGIRITRTSEVIIGNPRESFPLLLNLTNAVLGNLTIRIAQLPPGIQATVNSRLNTSVWKTRIQAIQTSAAQANNDSDYAALVGQLLALQLPRDVAVSSSGKVPITLGLDKVEVGFVQALANTSVIETKQEELRQNLIDWNQRSYGGDATFSVVSVADKDGTRPLLTYFVITPVARSTELGTVYFVIDRPRESITFIGSPDIRAVAGEGVSGTAVRVGSSPLEFYIDEEISYQELGAHFVPAISALGSYKDREEKEPPKYPTGLVIFWISLLVVSTLILYLILQTWYQRHYEHYLFANSDDLYNVMTFIQNSRQSGMSDDAIHKDLKSSAWSGEQLSYAFKKIDGKRTGMFELPFFKGSERRKIQAEIQRRQQGGGRKVY